jgi:hypothetical protein
VVGPNGCGKSTILGGDGIMLDFGLTAFWFLSRAIVTLLYFLPTIAAARYRHPKQPAILLLNLSLGWTIVAWIIALRWALKSCPSRNESGSRLK